MSEIERYVADQIADGMPMVLDMTSTPASIVCCCRTDADAEMIARAFNTHGTGALAREPGWNEGMHDANEAARRIFDAIGGQLWPVEQNRRTP